MESKSIYETTAGLEPTSMRDRLTGATHAPALTILSHPDLTRIGARCLLTKLLEGEKAAVSRVSPDFAIGGDKPRPILDLFVSRRPFYLGCDVCGCLYLDPGRSRTRIRLNGEPVMKRRALTTGEMENGAVLALSDRVVLLLHRLPLQMEQAPHFGMIGESEAWSRLRSEISRLTDIGTPILVVGETGVGKELAAQAIHAASSRRDGKLVSVNLGAIPSALAASELFGSVKGAYTGAVQNRQGYFKAAHGGSLFLDEIGEASLDVQAALLRVLETGEVYSVGSHKPIDVDVRIISATEANLHDRVAQGAFKAPLLHRLSGYEIWLPPLRERKDDVGRLFYHFAGEEMKRLGNDFPPSRVDEKAEPWIPADLATRLALFDWPGNVRQLKNVARQLVIGNRGRSQLRMGMNVARILEPSHPKPDSPDSETKTPSTWRQPDSVGEKELEEAMEASAWDFKAAAAWLRVSRSSLYDLVDKHPRLRIASQLSDGEIDASFLRENGDLDAMARHLMVSRRALAYRVRKLGLR